MSGSTEGTPEHPKSDDPRNLLIKITQTIKPVLVVGLGLRWIWMCAFLYSAFPSLILTNPAFAYAQYPLGVVYIFFFILVTFGMGALSDRITFFIRRRKFQVFVSIIFVVSSASLFLSNELLPIPLIVFAESINGLASGFMLLLWSEGYRRREPLTILTNSVLSVTFGFIIFRLIIFLLPSLVASVIFSVIPLIEFVFLYLTLHGRKAFTQPQQFTVTEQGTKIAAPGVLEIPTFHKLKVQRGKFFVRIGIPFLFFGMVLKIICDLVFRSAIEPSYLSMPWSDFLLTSLVPCLIMLVIAFVFIATNQSDDCEQYYRYIIPVASIFLLLACFQWMGSLSSIFTATSYLCLEFMLWMELCVISHRYRISPILVVGFGRGAIAVGMFFISVVSATALGAETILSSGILYTFMLVLLVVGYSLLPREKDIRAMVDPDSIADTEAADDDEKDASQGDDYPSRAENRFIARCERIANMFLLSPREVEVFFLLAKGRNTAYISKHLFISEGTVHTHMRRIYKKLNIHRQQELIDMVDASYAKSDASSSRLNESNS